MNERNKKQGVAESLNKEALHRELLETNQEMKLNHPRYNNPNSPGHTDRYYQLMKKKDILIALLQQNTVKNT